MRPFPSIDRPSSFSGPRHVLTATTHPPQAHGYAHWLPILWPLRHDFARAAAKAAADASRFCDTHVAEPFKGIAQELFHGYEPTIDPTQVGHGHVHVHVGHGHVHVHVGHGHGARWAFTCACAPRPLTVRAWPSQVRATRESLVRMLEDFVRDHGVAGGDEAVAEAMAEAAKGSMGIVTSAFEAQVRTPITSLVNGRLLRSLLLIMQQLRLLMEEEVAAVDVLLKRNDFNLQVLATIPALGLFTLILLGLRKAWRRLRSSDAARREPIDALQAEVIAIDALLTRDEGDHTIRHGLRPRAFQRGALSAFEASPMALSEVGELVFRVQRLRKLGSSWLRGLLRTELMHDAQVLLDSGSHAHVHAHAQHAHAHAQPDARRAGAPRLGQAHR